MEKLLHEITRFPEVTGTLVYDKGKGILSATSLPANMQTQPLETTAAALERIFAARDTVNGLEIRFEDGVLLARPVSDSASLITFCVPTVNVGLVNMTISMVIPKLRAAIDELRRPPAPAPQPVAPAPQPPPKAAAETKPPPKEPVDIDRLLKSGPLVSTLEKFQTALAFAIGPIGEMVMRDCLEEWSKGGDCTQPRLGELAKIVCREINDPGLEDEFREKVQPLL